MYLGVLIIQRLKGSFKMKLKDTTKQRLRRYFKKSTSGYLETKAKRDHERDDRWNKWK